MNINVNIDLDAIKEKVGTIAQAGVAQSKRLAEIAKLKMANMSEEDTIKKAYLEIGKLYYAEKGAAPDGAYAAACERITAARAAIETNKDRIAELKASGAEEEPGEEEPSEEAAVQAEAEQAEAETPPAEEE